MNIFRLFKKRNKVDSLEDRLEALRMDLIQSIRAFVKEEGQLVHFMGGINVHVYRDTYLVNVVTIESGKLYFGDDNERYKFEVAFLCTDDLLAILRYLTRTYNKE